MDNNQFILYGFREDSDALQLKKFHTLGGAIIGLQAVLENTEVFFNALEIRTTNNATGRTITKVHYERDGIGI